MNRFDPELVAALAEGALEAEEAAAFKAQIAVDPAALAELAKQQTALAAIRASQAPKLDSAERTTLRARIADELGLTASESPSVARPRRVAWGAIGVAASALIAIVAFAPVAGLLKTGGNDVGDLSFAEVGTTTSRQSDGDGSTASTLATASADAPEIAPTTLSSETATAGGEEYATTTAAGMIERSAYGPPNVADDLALLKDDPSALEELGAPVESTTPCINEATEALGSGELRSFAYSPSGDDAANYQVFFLQPADGSYSMVAFEPGDCTTPFLVP